MKRKIGFALLKGAISLIPVVGKTAEGLVQSWELDETVRERVEAAVDARVRDEVVPRLEELVRSTVTSASGNALEQAAARAIGDLSSETRAGLADQLQNAGSLPPTEAASLAASVVGAILDTPEIRDLANSPLLNGPGAVRVETGSKLAGRYRVLGVLGMGAHATVYRALDEELGRPVAIKVSANTEAGWRRQIEREARHLAALDDSGIVRVHSVVDVMIGDGPPHPAIVMEYVEGCTLRSFVAERGGKLTWANAQPYVERVLRALEHAHGRGVLHLDVKPENVLVRERDRLPKVVDFGLARTATPVPGQTKMIGGTPGYIAPELLTDAEPTAAADIFSAGVLIYELLSGIRPACPDPAPLRSLGVQIPATVDASLLRALATDPARRFHGASEFWSALSRPETPGAVPAAPARVRNVPPGLESVARGRTLALSSVIACPEDAALIAIAAGGDVLAVAGGRTVHVLSATGAARVPALAIARGRHVSLALTRDGQTVATSSVEPAAAGHFGPDVCTLRVWDVADAGAPRFSWTQKGHSTLQLSADGRRLVSAGPGADEIIMWDLASGNRVWSRPASNVRNVALSDDGALVLAIVGGELHVLRARDGELERRSGFPGTTGETNFLETVLSLPGDRALLWTPYRHVVEGGKTVVRPALLKVMDREGRIERSHDTRTITSARSVSVATELVYWVGEEYVGPDEWKAILGATDLKSGVEIERLELGKAGFTLDKIQGSEVAAWSRGAAVLVKGRAGERRVLLYEIAS